MKIEEYKNEFQKTRAPGMEAALTNEGSQAFDDVLRCIKRQDAVDEKYLLRRIIPLLVGVILFTIVMIINPVRHPIMLTGCLLIFLTLLYSLMLYFNDYKNISSETFDTTVMEFLQQKEKRLQRWQSTPLKYNIVFGLYIIGVIMMILGNPAVHRKFPSAQITIYLAAIVIVLLVSWIIGENRHQKRHQIQHQPLLDIIADVKTELDRDA